MLYDEITSKPTHSVKYIGYKISAFTLPGFGGVARLQPIFQINEAGQIVFRATSQGGNGPGNAILRADPVIDSTPVPTPALLPGLVGMGVAALRKRKQETELEA